MSTPLKTDGRRRLIVIVSGGLCWVVTTAGKYHRLKNAVEILERGGLDAQIDPFFSLGFASFPDYSIAH